MSVTFNRLKEMRAFPPWLVWVLGGVLVAAMALVLSQRRAQLAPLHLGRRTATAVAPESETWPALSPDGRIVMYSLNSGGTTRLGVQQVKGGIRTMVSDGIGGAPAISPNGDRLLYSAGDQGLYVMPIQGGLARLVVPGRKADGSPNRSILPPERLVVFHDADSDLGESPSGGRGLAGLEGLVPGAWSPDGQEIVYRDGHDTLVVQSLEQSGRRVLVSGNDLHSPAWSGDGKWIAYVEGNWAFHHDGNRGSSRIMVVPAEGGTPVAVTDSTSLNTSPIWIPGHRALLFVSDKDGGRDIYQLALKRSGAPAGPAARISTGLDPERINLSADGRRLAWSVFTEPSNLGALPIPGRDSVVESRADVWVAEVGP